MRSEYLSCHPNLSQENATPCVIDVQHTKEVVDQFSISPVPKQHPDILGICDIRGHVVSVFDLGSIMGLTAPSQINTEQRKLIILELQDHWIGCCVDAVERIVTIAPEQVQPAPKGSEGRMIQGVAYLEDERLYQVVAIEAIAADLGFELS